MFLMNLNERTKMLFIELCVLAAKSNGEFDESEYEMIYAYCAEMQIEKSIPLYEIDLDNVLKKLCDNCNMIEKQIITLELIGLLYADGEFDDSEKEFLEKCVSSFGLSDEKVSEIKGLFNEYLEMYQRMTYSIMK